MTKVNDLRSASTKEADLSPVVPPDRILAAIIESSDDAIIGKTLDGIIISWNRAAERLYGYSAEEAVGQPIALIIPADRPGELPAIMERLRRGERIDHFQTIRVPKDGVRLELSVSISPIRDDAGHIVGAASIGRDITEQKRIEREHRELEVPREAFAPFLLPRNTGLFGPTFRGEGTVRIADVRKDVHFGKNPWHYGISEGHLPVVSYLAVPVIGRAGEVLGGLFFGHSEAGVFGDRAQRLAEGLATQAAAAVANARLFQQAQQELAARRHAEAEKEAFIDAVAHDLGNPLTAVKGQAQLLLRRARKGRIDAETVETSLTAIDAAVVRANRLIAELSDVARLGAHRPLELRHSLTDLVELTRDRIATYASAISHDVRLERGVPELVGLWDADRLTRVLENLPANAVKYSPTGSLVVVRLDREETPEGEEAVITVSDHGVGIPAADLPYIFERFRRGGNVAGRFAGTGIGLCGSRRVVAQHGGDITIASTEGQGTTVIVRLPLGTEAHITDNLPLASVGSSGAESSD